MIPDRADGPADGRNMVAMGKDRIFLFGNPHRAEFARQIGEVGNFNAGDVIEIAGIVAVTADTIGYRTDPAGDVRHRLMEALPLTGNASAVFMIISLAESRDEQWLAGFKTRCLQIVRKG